MHRRIGEILIDRGLISEIQLDKALRLQTEQQTYLGQVLYRIGVPMWHIEDALREQRETEERRY